MTKYKMYNVVVSGYQINEAMKGSFPMNRKKIFTLCLVLVLAVVVCVSCGKKEEKAEEIHLKVAYENQTSEELAKIHFKDRINTGKSWESSNVAAGAKTEMEIIPTLKNGAPDVEVTVERKNGEKFQSSIITKKDQKMIIRMDGDKLVVELTDK